jgi:hypothetical protein
MFVKSGTGQEEDQGRSTMQSDIATVAGTPIACTLTASDYKERLGQIAELARDALRSHNRTGLVLTLRYDAAAAERVRDMVRRERDCCAFLTFECSKQGNEIVVTISAPEEAKIAAETLFEQFVTPAPTASAKAARVALGCACGAVACGAACVAPLMLPGVALAGTGVILAWLASAHSWMTVLGSIAVAAAWLWIWRQASGSGQRPSRSTLYMMAAATFLLALALAWPLLEPQIARALGAS